MSSVKRKRSAYDDSFKLKVVKYAEDCGNNRKTAAEFGISENKSGTGANKKHIFLFRNRS